MGYAENGYAGNTGIARRVLARILGLGLAAAMAAWGAAPACAKAKAPSAYPDRPIDLVLPFPPGGGTDTLARIMAPKLGDELGQSVVVLNRPGASGNIATELVSKAAPDGYTVLMGFSTALTVNPLLYKNLAFDIQRDFKPVTLLASAKYVLVVDKSIPVKSVKGLIALAKSEPGRLNYSSSGVGSPLNLAAELFKLRTGTNIRHIPYKGGGPATMGLLSGQVQLMFGSVAAVMPYVHQGRLRALAVTSLDRSSVAPQLPTLAESGLPGFDVTSWYGLLVPKNTPNAIVERLRAAVLKVMKSPEVRQAMSREGLDVATDTPAEFAKRIRTDTRRWADLVRKMKISID